MFINIILFCFVLNTIYFETIKKQYKYYTNLSGYFSSCNSQTQTQGPVLVAEISLFAQGFAWTQEGELL